MSKEPAKAPHRPSQVKPAAAPIVQPKKAPAPRGADTPAARAMRKAAVPTPPQKAPNAQPSIVHYTKNAAVPPIFDFGWVRSGTAQSWPIANLVQGDRALVRASLDEGNRDFTILSPVSGEFLRLAEAGVANTDKNQTIKLRYSGQETVTSPNSILRIVFQWDDHRRQPEEFRIPVVANGPDRYAEERKRMEHEKEAKDRQKAADDKRATEAKEKFYREHPFAPDSLDFGDGIKHADNWLDKIQKLQILGAMTNARKEIEGYKEAPPQPWSPGLLWDLGIMALDLAVNWITGGLANRIAKRLTQWGLTDVLPNITSRTRGQHKAQQDKTEAKSLSITGLAKEAVAGVTNTTKNKLLKDWMERPKNVTYDQRQADRKELTTEFFNLHGQQLIQLQGKQEDAFIEKIGLLRPLHYANPKAGAAAIWAIGDSFEEEASAGTIPEIHAQRTVEAFARWLVPKNFLPQLDKLNRPEEGQEINRVDGLIDIEFTHDGQVFRGVTRAFMFGVAPEVVRRFQIDPLISYNVTVRAYTGRISEEGSFSTVVRYPDGRIEYKEEYKKGDPYLNRKGFFERIGRGNPEDGAKYVMEYQIMNRSLESHGVQLEHNHVRPKGQDKGDE